jgi:hypothetical protein
MTHALRCYEYHSSTPVYPLIPSLRDEGNFIETGCGTPTSEASAVDIEGVTNQAARAALWYLQDKLDSKNHCLIINEETNEMPENLQQPGVYWDTWLPVTGCPACKTRK